MKRPQFDRADWHITLRGARRLALFHDPEDYQVFYGMLGKFCRDTEVGVFADCLMTNHFHLGLTAGTKQLGRCMQRLDRGYSGYHNSKYNLEGHAYDRVYFSVPILSNFVLQRVGRYIHLNPSRTGTPTAPDRHPWSNYRRLTSSSPLALNPDEARFLRTFSPDHEKSQDLYSRFVLKDLQRKRARKPGRISAWEIWQEQFGWIREHTEENTAALEPLDPLKVALYLGNRVGIPPRTMAAAVGDLNGMEVSQIVYRLGRRLAEDPALHAKVDALQVL